MKTLERKATGKMDLLKAEMKVTIFPRKLYSDYELILQPILMSRPRPQCIMNSDTRAHEMREWVINKIKRSNEKLSILQRVPLMTLQ